MNSEPSTRKRKQNTLDESDTPSKKQCNQPAAPDDTSPRAAPASSLSDAVPFSLECPVRKVVKKGKQQAIKGDVFGPKEEDGGFPNLKISYAIRPGNSWTDLRTYRNFSSKLEIELSHTDFEDNQLIHVLQSKNRSSPQDRWYTSTSMHHPLSHRRWMPRKPNF